MQSIRPYSEGCGARFADPPRRVSDSRSWDTAPVNNAAFTGATTLGNFNPVAVGDPSTVAAQVFNFAPTKAQFVRFTATQSNGFDGATVGEVAFDLPEPTAALLLVLGAGSLLLKRRQA